MCGTRKYDFGDDHYLRWPLGYARPPPDWDMRDHPQILILGGHWDMRDYPLIFTSGGHCDMRDHPQMQLA